MKDKFIIFLGHGAFPSDFPREKLKRYLFLRSKFFKKNLKEREKKEFEKLEKEILDYKRTKRNDSHFYFHKKLSEEIQKKLKIKCFFAFNEFCAPLLDDVIKELYERNKKADVLIVPTMFSGGYHVGKEIPEKIKKLKKKYKGMKLYYLLPFKNELIIEFFVKSIRDKFLK